jgi:hypothetical protein
LNRAINPSVNQKIFIDVENKNLKDQKVLSPKTEFVLQNQSCVICVLYGEGKNMFLGVKQVKISHQSPKTEFWL